MRGFKCSSTPRAVGHESACVSTCATSSAASIVAVATVDQAVSGLVDWNLTQGQNTQVKQRLVNIFNPGCHACFGPGFDETAKARFSELFRRARTVLPAEQFAQLTKRVRQPKSLVRFFAESPLTRVTLDLSRDVDSGREINYDLLPALTGYHLWSFEF